MNIKYTDIKQALERAPKPCPVRAIYLSPENITAIPQSNGGDIPVELSGIKVYYSSTLTKHEMVIEYEANCNVKFRPVALKDYVLAKWFNGNA